MLRLLALTLLAVLGVALLAPSAGAQGAGDVVVTRVEGTISPVVADHVAEVLQEAALVDAELVVLTLDTPGGLDAAMRQIVQDMIASPVPVAVLVEPPGARAASAGAVITLAAHVAAMEPGTTIGAATPIDLGGGQVADKVVNDAVAYVEAIAELRGRDATFYIDAVREGRAVPAAEALQLGAVDLLVDDIDELLAAVDGMGVDVRGRGTVGLTTAGADVVTVELSAVRSLLQRLASPDLAFLLLAAGALAIVFEVASPGGGFVGAAGAVMLIMAFFALSVLPVNIAGLLLVLLAAGLFAAEAFVPGVGAFAAGGALSLGAAGLLLFPRASGVAVSLGLLLAVAALSGVAAVLTGHVAVQARQAPPTVGAAGTIVGAVGVVKEADGLAGQALIEGARWQVVSDAPLRPGDRVEVVALDGLTARVARADALPSTSPS